MPMCDNTNAVKPEGLCCCLLSPTDGHSEVQTADELPSFTREIHGIQQGRLWETVLKKDCKSREIESLEVGFWSIMGKKPQKALPDGLKPTVDHY